MIKVFCGDDRMRANQEIKRFLGENYEIFEGADLEPKDLPSLFKGGTLFEEKRRILIRDITVNKIVSEKIKDYVDSPHDVAILESKISKNSVFYKELKTQAEFLEFKVVKASFYNEVLAIYNIAKKDGKKAVKMLEEKNNEDPMGFMGMLVTIALKDFEKKQGRKEKRVLEELSKLDLEMKSTSYPPFLLLSAFLLRVSSL